MCSRIRLYAVSFISSKPFSSEFFRLLIVGSGFSRESIVGLSSSRILFFSEIDFLNFFRFSWSVVNLDLVASISSGFSTDIKSSRLIPKSKVPKLLLSKSSSSPIAFVVSRSDLFFKESICLPISTLFSPINKLVRFSLLALEIVKPVKTLSSINRESKTSIEQLKLPIFHLRSTQEISCSVWSTSVLTLKHISWAIGPPFLTIECLFDKISGFSFSIERKISERVDLP